MKTILVCILVLLANSYRYN